MLPKSDVEAVRHYCERRIPPGALGQLRVEAVVEDHAVTIVERRPPWRADFAPEWTSSPVARLRYTAKTRLWTLFCSDANERWHRYDGVEPSGDVGVLLGEVERDPTGIFWG